MKRILFTLFLAFTGGYASSQCNPHIYTTSGNNYICDGGPAYIHASPADSYQWYLDGVAISGATSEYCPATLPGSYMVEVDSAGCIAMSSAIILVAHSSPDTPGTITGNDAFCAGSTQTFSIDAVAGTDRYSWWISSPTDWSDFYEDSTNIVTGVVGESDNGGSPQVTIYVSAINECGSKTSSKVVEVYSQAIPYGHDPTLDISNLGGYLCPGNIEVLTPFPHGSFGYIGPTTYQWLLDGSPIPGATNLNLSIARGGHYQLQISGNSVCPPVYYEKPVHQNVPSSLTITPSGPLNYCSNNVQPLQVTFDMTGVDGDFEWFWIKGSFTNLEYNVYSVLPDTPGYYHIWASDEGGWCRVMYNSSGVQVTVPPLLEVTQIDDTLFATPGYDSYQWYESGNLLVGETQQKHTLQFDGFYSVEGIFMNGCVENSNPFDSDFMPPPPPPPGINLQEPTEQMTISPNPFTNNFVLQAKVAKEDSKATISITDATGRILFEKEADAIDGVIEEKIDLGDASSTVGTIRLRSPSTLKTIRFFKK